MDSMICEAPIKKKRSTSGGTVCCVPGCNNNTKSGRHVSWHVFPKDRRIRDEWLRRVKRRGQFVDGIYFRWEPKYHHRVCGAHFDPSGVKQKCQEVPTLFPVRPTEPPVGRSGRRRNRRAKLDTSIVAMEYVQNIQRPSNGETSDDLDRGWRGERKPTPEGLTATHPEVGKHSDTQCLQQQYSIQVNANCDSKEERLSLAVKKNDSKTHPKAQQIRENLFQYTFSYVQPLHLMEKSKFVQFSDLSPPEDDMESRFLITSGGAGSTPSQQGGLNANASPAYRYNGFEANKVHSVDQIQNMNHQIFFNMQDSLYVADSFPPKNGCEDLKATVLKQASIIEKLETDNRLLRQQLQDAVIKSSQLQAEIEDLKKVVFDKATGVKLVGQSPS